MSGENYASSSDKQIEIPFSDDEVVRDDELIVDDAKASPEEKMKRSEARKARAAERERERKQQAEELRALRESSAKTAQELAELRGFVAARQAPAAPADGKDEFERRLDAVYEKQENAFKAYQAEMAAGTFTPERKKHYEQIAREVESEKAAVNAERVLAARAPLQQQASARQIWEQKYPEVYGNPQAFKYAQATFHRRDALGEKVTVEEIMDETMATFKLGPKKPAASERSRLSGIPSSGAGGGDRSGEGIVMTPVFKQMATSKYSHLPEAEAIKQWVNNEGKALRAKKVI